MAKENVALTTVLEREFERIRKLKNDSTLGRTSGEMANFLHIPASTMSHYRAGNRFLSRTTAREIADILRSDEFGGNPKERESLAEELLTSRPVGTENQAQAQDWLRSIGREGHLLLVEFRDYPSARSSNPNKQVAREMAREAGQAVAKGLTYALLNPFPSTYQASPDVPTVLKNYLNLLADAIRDTYQRILEEAYLHVFLDNPSSLNLKGRVESVRKRLRVYAWNDSSTNPENPLRSCPGLGYKLFYHREDLNTPELWHWLSTPNGEMLMPKTKQEVELAAVESRFYPIIDFFEEENHLPSTKEMQQFADREFKKEPFWLEVDAIPGQLDIALIDRAKRRASAS